ncbi:hypothetical protein FDP41_008574 [Naegleria fowleri]|uniref:Uncharacterized protein n=1 Tax=Naegleria fowleri TaxID=5763 RepID=A0A6A5B715_NAEFO|nr:uncharacterized protein FDP41_008574 [Naegleria fowleri]KAF0973367.1 hypothetical protein FDP41_008574 [Naegleria fowleri]
MKPSIPQLDQSLNHHEESTVELIQKSMNEWSGGCGQRICPFCLRAISYDVGCMDSRTPYDSRSSDEEGKMNDDEEEYSQFATSHDNDILFKHVSKCLNLWKMERRRRIDSERKRLMSKLMSEQTISEEESFHKRKMNEMGEMHLSNKKTKIEFKYDTLSQVGSDMIYHIMEYLDWRFCVLVA